MQAIITKYAPATNRTGARIIARCQAKRIVVPYTYEGDEHRKAAEQLANLLGWHGTWVGGGLPDGSGDCYVLTDGQDTFTVVER